MCVYDLSVVSTVSVYLHELGLVSMICVCVCLHDWCDSLTCEGVRCAVVSQNATTSRVHTRNTSKHGFVFFSNNINTQVSGQCGILVSDSETGI